MQNSAAEEALGLTDPVPVVNPALILHQHQKHSLRPGQRDSAVVVFPEQRAHPLAVEEHRGSVADLAERQHTGPVTGDPRAQQSQAGGRVSSSKTGRWLPSSPSLRCVKQPDGLTQDRDEGGRGPDGLGKQVPLGCVADADEIANAIVVLTTDKASYITGAILNVDGGCTAI